MTARTLPVLGVVARDPAFAAVAARQRTLLDDAITHWRTVPSRTGAARTTRRRWSLRPPEVPT